MPLKGGVDFTQHSLSFWGSLECEGNLWIPNRTLTHSHEWVKRVSHWVWVECTCSGGREYSRKRQSTFTSFIDFTKVYDSINRDLRFRKLLDMGLTDRIHKTITSRYDNAKCCVRINGLKMDYFEVSCGLKQSCFILRFYLIYMWTT